MGSSPHTRGALRARGSQSVAGKDHPRIRGEHSKQATTTPPPSGSSPHTRGAPGRCPRSSPLGRIIPAYAGSTWFRERPTASAADHPRIRGEHARVESRRGVQRGSSPHTRGARPRWDRQAQAGRIIPAYAGSTSLVSQSTHLEPDHPRIRGEHVFDNPAKDNVPGSSPHTRGAQTSGIRSGSACRIIPAYAGSTCRLVVFRYASRDHPRIRGEHVNKNTGRSPRDGSSPHTRGARLEIPAIPRIAAVIIPVFLYPSPTPQEEADRSMVLLTLS